VHSIDDEIERLEQQLNELKQLKESLENEKKSLVV
jgi:restriction endonuclease S subunit